MQLRYNTCYSFLYTGIIWVLIEFSNISKIPTICPFFVWKVWKNGFKVPIFFWWILSTYLNKVVFAERFIKQNHTHETISLYPVFRQCVSAGESGLLLAVKPPNTVTFYLGPKAMNEKKLMKNVLQLGDEFFNFGDLVYLDHDYYVYFRDRIGDTFR